MKPKISGIGVVGGFGCGIREMAEALDNGGPRPTPVSIDKLEGPVETVGFRAETGMLKEFASPKALRRIDPYNRMAILGAFLAMEDARANGFSEPDRMGIIVGSGYGSTCNTFDVEGLCLENNIQGFSPLRFSNSVHNAAASHISAFLHIRGPVLSISHFDISVPLSLMTACHWLREGRADAVLVGGVDAFSKRMALHRLEGGKRNRGTFSEPVPVGEGCAFFLLTQAEGKTESGYGCIADVETGIWKRKEPSLERGAIHFIGADGFSETESALLQGLPEDGADYGIYTPLYGHLPVGTGFDLAIACLSRKRNRLYPPAQGTITSETPLDERPICCIKPGAAGEWGRIVLCR